MNTVTGKQAAKKAVADERKKVQVANGPANFWPSKQLRHLLNADALFVLDHHEEWVQKCKCGRRPSNRPVKVWGDGRVRIEFGGNFSSISEAARAMRADLERIS